MYSYSEALQLPFLLEDENENKTENENKIENEQENNDPIKNLIKKNKNLEEFSKNLNKSNGSNIEDLFSLIKNTDNKIGSDKISNFKFEENFLHDTLLNDDSLNLFNQDINENDKINEHEDDLFSSSDKRIEDDTVNLSHATSFSGKKIRIRKRNKAAINADFYNEKDALRKSHYGLNMQEILHQVEIENEINRIQQNNFLDTNCDNDNNNDKVDKLNELWSEKYRPQYWTDLVGEEKTHRQVLRWLKKWDPAVFGSKPSDLLHLSNTNNIKPDKYYRPDKKILLLNGPPGIGKTTLAHIAAKKCGYDILEINASDERAGQKVKDKIHSAIESQQIGFNGENLDSSKPVCIIADEIEGAVEFGFIKILIDIIEQDKILTASVSDNEYRKNKKKKKDGTLLLRPIIGICNDLFASTLHRLRPYCEIATYHRTTTSSLTERLIEICKIENISVSQSEITSLVDQTNGDMRSCLNLLQFGGYNINSASPAQREKNSVKDSAFSSNALVDKIFTQSIPRLSSYSSSLLPPSKNSANENNKIKNYLSTSNQDNNEGIDSLEKMIDLNSEYDKLMMGCFSLYPFSHYTDDMFKKPGKAGDWYFFSDCLNRHIYKEHHMEMGSYLSLPILGMHLLFSSMTNSAFTPRSRMLTENFNRTNSSNNNASSALAGSDLKYSLLKNYDLTRTDFLAREINRESNQILQDLIAKSESQLWKTFTAKKNICMELAPFLIQLADHSCTSKKILEHSAQCFIGCHVKLVPLASNGSFSHKYENDFQLFTMQPNILLLSPEAMQSKHSILKPLAAMYSSLTSLNDFNSNMDETKPVFFTKKTQMDKKRRMSNGKNETKADYMKAIKENQAQGSKGDNLRFKAVKTSLLDFCKTGGKDKDDLTSSELKKAKLWDSTQGLGNLKERNAWVEYASGHSNAVKKIVYWDDLWKHDVRES